MGQGRSEKKWVLVVVLLSAGGAIWGRDGQAELDRGEDLLLLPGEVLEVKEPLVMKRRGQTVRTVGAAGAASFGVIRKADGAGGTLIEGRGVAGIVIEDVILDGNRRGMDAEGGVVLMEPMLSLGGEGGDGQRVQRCLVVDSRSAGGGGWGTTCYSPPGWMFVGMDVRSRSGLLAGGTVFPQPAGRQWFGTT